MRISQTHGHTLRPKLCARNSKWSVQSNFQTIFRCGRSKVNIHKCSTDTRKKWLTLKHRYILQIYVLADRQRKTNKMSCRRHTHSPAFSSEAEASYIYGGLPKGGKNPGLFAKHSSRFSARHAKNDARLPFSIGADHGVPVYAPQSSGFVKRSWPVLSLPTICRDSPGRWDRCPTLQKPILKTF